MSIARTRFMAVGLALVGSGLAISLLKAQQNGSPAWVVGDVFVAIGSGQYEVRDKNNNYQVKQTIQTLVTPRKDVGGCWFDSQFNLYTTDIEHSKVVKFNLANSHTASTFADTNAEAPDGRSNSIVMAVNGDVFVGHAAGAPPELLTYRSDGVFLDSDTPAVESGGIDWMDLATDQRTMFYTSRGRLVKRFNVETDAQLGDFATLPGTGTAYAIRLLGPSFNGADGLLVADTVNIKRLNNLGAVVATYDYDPNGTNNDENDWRSLNLDPDGIHFWAGGFTSGRLYRFNLASGTPDLGPIQPSANNNKAMGICVMGEPQTQVFAMNLSNPTNATVLIDKTASFGDPTALSATSFYSFSTWRLRINVKANRTAVTAIGFTPQTTDLQCLGTPEDDFDCRFTATPAQCVPFFNDPSATDTGTLDQYRCAFYRVKDMPLCQASNPGACPFQEEFVPGTNDILSEILMNMTNPPEANFSVAPYGPAPKGNPRLMRDPDSVSTGPLANQFFIDATTAVIDWPAFGTGTPNDYSPVMRFTETVGGGCADVIKPDGTGMNGGSTAKIIVEAKTGPRVGGICTGTPLTGATENGYNLTLAIHNPATSVTVIYCDTPGNSLGCFTPVNGQDGRYQSTVDLANPPFIPDTGTAYFFAVTSVNTPTADPNAQKPGLFPPTGRSYFICPTGSNCGG